MDNKLNREQMSKYSHQVAAKLLNLFFADREKISGEEILNFCAIRQVNLFALKILFQKWKHESKKLESPYFNYEHQEVVEAIEHLGNTVSRHILATLTSFKPILTKAISETLMLICSPYHFYVNELNSLSGQGRVVAEGLREIKKFTKINLPILEGLIAHRQLSKPWQKGLDMSKILDKVVADLSSDPEDMDSYIATFSNYVPISIDDIYLDAERPSVGEPEPTENVAEVIKEEPADFVHSKEFTLNETLASENQMSLADIHEQQKIESLSKGITLNQRFMFVNVLFDGDIVRFNNTVLELDGLADLSEAEDYLNTHFGHWNKCGHEVEDFMNILKRRFF